MPYLSATKQKKEGGGAPPFNPREKGGGLLDKKGSGGAPPFNPGGGGKATVSAGGKKPRIGGGRWRKNAAGQGGRGSMGSRSGGRGQGQGNAPGRPGGGKRPGNRTGARRGSPERKAIHAERSAQRKAGTRAPRGHRQNQMGGGGQPMPRPDMGWQGQMPGGGMQMYPGMNPQMMMGAGGMGGDWQSMMNQGGSPMQIQPGMSPFGGMLNGGQQNPWGGGPSPQLGSMGGGMAGRMRMNPYQMR